MSGRQKARAPPTAATGLLDEHVTLVLHTLDDRIVDKLEDFPTLNPGLLNGDGCFAGTIKVEPAPVSPIRATRLCQDQDVRVFSLEVVVELAAAGARRSVPLVGAEVKRNANGHARHDGHHAQAHRSCEFVASTRPCRKGVGEVQATCRREPAGT